VVLPDIWSRRKRDAERNDDDVWTYDDAPRKLRVQMLRILISTTECADQSGSLGYIFGQVNKDLKDELGLYQLSDQVSARDDDIEEFAVLVSA
jgi:hypothetical protein